VPVIPYFFVVDPVRKLHDSSLVHWVLLTITLVHARQTRGKPVAQPQRARNCPIESSEETPKTDHYGQTFLTPFYRLLLHSSVNTASGLQLPKCELGITVLCYGTRLL